MIELTDLRGWNRDLYLVHYYDPARWHAIKRWSNTSIDEETRAGIATDALFALAARFPKWCEKAGKEPTGALFFTILRKEIDEAIIHHLRTKKNRAPVLFGALHDANDGDTWVRNWLTGGDLSRIREPSLLHQSIADYIACLPMRCKVLLALRFREELTMREIEPILGLTPTGQSSMLQNIAGRVLAYALHETVDHPVDVYPYHGRPWQPPERLHRWVWLNTRFVDVYAFLGAAQRAYQDDVTHIVDIISMAHGNRTFVTTSARPSRRKPCGTEAAYLRHQTEGTPVDEACERAHAEHHAEKMRRQAERRRSAAIAA